MLSQYVDIEQFVLIDKIYRCHLFIVKFAAAVQANDSELIKRILERTLPDVLEKTKPIVISEEEDKKND